MDAIPLPIFPSIFWQRFSLSHVIHLFAVAARRPPPSATRSWFCFVGCFPRTKYIRCVSSTHLLSPALLGLSGRRIPIQFIRLQQLHDKFMASRCCSGIWSDSSIGFRAVCNVGYGTRGRFAEMEAAAYAGKEIQNIQYGVTFTCN